MAGFRGLGFESCKVWSSGLRTYELSLGSSCSGFPSCDVNRGLRVVLIIAVKERNLSYYTARTPLFMGNPIIYDIYPLYKLNLSSSTATQLWETSMLDSERGIEPHVTNVCIQDTCASLFRHMGGYQNYGPFLGYPKY